MLCSSIRVVGRPVGRAVRAASTAASPLAPFHIAIPVSCLDAARKFYGDVLRCEEGRSSSFFFQTLRVRPAGCVIIGMCSTWIDWNLYGHQLVTHFASKAYKGLDYFNNVDKDMVPVPHFGVCLTVSEFHDLAARLRGAGVTFLVEPHLRFPGKAGEQWTMFFKDPAGNNLEFKAMTNPANLFAKYFVDDERPLK